MLKGIAIIIGAASIGSWVYNVGLYTNRIDWWIAFPVLIFEITTVAMLLYMAADIDRVRQERRARRMKELDVNRKIEEQRLDRELEERTNRVKKVTAQWQ